MTDTRREAPDQSRREGERSRRREALELCRTLESAPCGIAVVSARGKCLAANRAFARQLDCDSAAARGRNVLDGDDGRLRVLLKIARRGGEGSIDSPAFASEAAALRLRAESMASGSVLLMLEDRTEIELATRAFHASERRFDLLMDSSSEGILVYREESIFYANPAAVRMLGGSDMSDLVGRGLTEFVEVSAVDAFRRWLHAGRDALNATDATDVVPKRLEHQLRRIDGRLFDAEGQAFEAPVDDGPAELMFFRDVTETRRLETERAVSALGSIAGSVAHDFNNLLAGIHGSLSLVERNIGSPEAASRAINTARAAVEQAGLLTRELLTKSGGETPAVARVCVFDVIREVTELVRNMEGKPIQLSVAVSDETMAAQMARSQLHQILLNILVNGRDAVRENGKIHVSMCRSGAANEWIRLTVIDDGPGMDAETRKRIFQPFFTTKGPGKGTGLGLATVGSIVQQAGGRVEVESEPGGGAAFHVFLPNADLAGAAPGRPTSEVSQTLRSPRMPLATETTVGPAVRVDGTAQRHVIICDDDGRLGTLTASLLEDGGYHVDTHTDAAALLDGELGGAEVVLLDVHLGSQDVLPVLIALAERERPPAVVLTSGSAPEDVAEAIRNHPVVVDYLMKPYRPERLLACVSSAASGPGPDRTGPGPTSKSGTRRAYSTETRERPIRCDARTDRRRR